MQVPFKLLFEETYSCSSNDLPSLLHVVGFIGRKPQNHLESCLLYIRCQYILVEKKYQITSFIRNKFSSHTKKTKTKSKWEKIFFKSPHGPKFHQVIFILQLQFHHSLKSFSSNKLIIISMYEAKLVCAYIKPITNLYKKSVLEPYWDQPSFYNNLSKFQCAFTQIIN